MPLITARRIVIEEIDRETHDMPVDGKHFTLDCNVSFDLDFLYTGGARTVYQNGSRVMDMNTENYSFYGADIIVNHYDFQIALSPFLYGGNYESDDNDDFISYETQYSRYRQPVGLFSMHLFAENREGEDIVNYVLFQFPCCYASREALPIDSQFTQHQFTIHATNDFVNDIPFMNMRYVDSIANVEPLVARQGIVNQEITYNDSGDTIDVLRYVYSHR